MDLMKKYRAAQQQSSGAAASKSMQSRNAIAEQTLESSDQTSTLNSQEEQPKTNQYGNRARKSRSRQDS